MPVYHYLPFLLILIAIIIISVKTEKLTLAGALTGGLIALLIFIGAGYAGISMLAAFFVLGTAATIWKKNEKQRFKSTTDHTKRNSGQVLANGGVAAITGILAWYIPAQAELLRIMMAASLTSAMADTLSSELGMIYGRRFYNIATFKKDERGLDGVISLEGTLIGLAGSIIIAIIYAIGFGWNNAFFIILIAGTIGNLSDSFLGALLERKKYLNNDSVNFLNTLIAALAAALWGVLG
ncbi:MAG TPA: DUF92 domain-containing protein [Mucilaginibacter sp.]|jgi:uncharacterized protein (TIGR00297 family)